MLITKVKGKKKELSHLASCQGNCCLLYLLIITKLRYLLEYSQNHTKNKIWQMDVFHFIVFSKLRYLHHTTDMYSGFQRATALASEKADSVITHFLEAIVLM